MKNKKRRLQRVELVIVSVFARGLKSVIPRGPSSVTATSALQSFGAPLIYPGLTVSSCHVTRLNLAQTTSFQRNLVGRLKWKTYENLLSQLVKVITLFKLSVHYRWYSVVFKTCRYAVWYLNISQAGTWKHFDNIALKKYWGCGNMDVLVDDFDSAHISAALDRGCQS